MDFGTTLIFSILFGSIGMGYFVYGKKQQAALPLSPASVFAFSPISSPVSISWFLRESS